MANRIKLLFLGADPVDSRVRLRLGQEIREIEHRINSSPNAGLFEIISKWAVRPQDLVTALMRHRPTIVHFSGHAQANEIVLEDDDGNMKPIVKEQLESMFAVFKNTLRLVFLNACYSQDQLSGLSRIIQYTVGTNSALQDKTAVQFAAYFYQALAFGESVQTALELARCQCSLEGLPQSDVFSLRVREGVNASESFVKLKPRTRNASSSKRRLDPVKTDSTIEAVGQGASKLPKADLVGITDYSLSRRGIDMQPTPILHRSQSSRDISHETVPVEIQESLLQFRADYPDPDKVAFLMMRFGQTNAHKNIIAGIKKALDPLKITVARADDKQYHDDLFPNVLTYVYGCAFGIAVFERIETEEFNPNVALEVGYMFALRKPICLIKDKTLKTLHADLVGKLYRVFDPMDPLGTIPSELSQWLKDKGLCNPRS